ncbi:hypothetical protein [Oricola indica]
MKLTMQMTLDGLLRALRTRAQIAVDEKTEERRLEKPKPETEDSDERRA